MNKSKYIPLKRKEKEKRKEYKKKTKLSNKESQAEITVSPVIHVIEYYKSQLYCKKHFKILFGESCHRCVVYQKHFTAPYEQIQVHY